MIPVGHGIQVLIKGARYRLDTIVAEIANTYWWRWLLPSQYLPRPRTSSAVRLREALESLGPVFIKFGQILSTRQDLFPADYIKELRLLQNQVPPFDTETAIAIVESSLGKKLDEMFSQFEKQPVASASLAQVHVATTLGGDEVVVKVIRPDIEPIIRKDIALIYSIARILEGISSDARRLHLKEVVADYERTIIAELDFRLEAANTATLRRNFIDSPLLYAPRVYWGLTTKDVLVMERIDGVLISAIDRLRALGTDLKKLAERGVETFFTQVFEHNFFHADMHPGNIFIDVSDPSNPSYIAVDCAIIGQLSEEDQLYLAKNILAFFNKDYHAIARLHYESGWIPVNTDIDAFEAVIRKLCEPLFQKPLSQISFGHFLFALFNTARHFHMEVQPQLVLLQKTLLNIEGLGRQLYPDLDLWSTAKPFMERWVRRRFGPMAVIRELLERAPDFFSSLSQFPEKIFSSRDRVAELDRLVREQQKSLATLDSSKIESRTNKRALSIVGGLLVLGGIALVWSPIAAGAVDSAQAIIFVAGLSIAIVGSSLVGHR